MRKEFLLGFTKNIQVVFCNVEYRNNNCFSVSFDSSYPVEITRESAIESIEGAIESFDKEWVLNKLEEYDCKPSELAEKMYENSYNVVEEFFDNSLYPESFSIDGVENDIYFLASSCGQHDTRDEMNIYINRELYDFVHELWDEYHLKDIPHDKLDKLIEAIEHQERVIDDYKVIELWLTENFQH